MTGRFGSFQSGLFFINAGKSTKTGIPFIEIEAAPIEFVGLCSTFERVVLDEPLDVEDRKTLQSLREALMVIIANLPDPDFPVATNDLALKWLEMVRRDYGPDAKREDRR